MTVALRLDEEAKRLNLVDAVLNRVIGTAADKRLLRKLRPLLLAALRAAAEKAASDLGVDATIGLAHPIAEQYFKQRTPNLVGVNAFTRRRIRRVLAEEIAKGSPLGRQVARLRHEFRLFRRGRVGRPGSRARTVARTENGIAWGVGQHGQMKDVGVLAEVWITSRDARVRASHTTMEGQCQLIDDLFTTGAGNTLLYPLDPTGRLEEIINCRCVAAPAPRGCGESRLATYAQRTRHWRTIIAQQRPHERALMRALRTEWLTQEGRLVAALEAAA